MGHPLFDLTGRVAVVVGGTSGIGRALTEGLAQAGADVVRPRGRGDMVDQAAAAVEAAGRQTLRLTSDACDEASLEALCKSTLERFGKVDILVNCAGRTKRVPVLEMADGDWRD